ncbi:hypothetical protein COLO4_06598 [Corchorus olitorius]|uniref:Uncharacterized protein n=1 Tax=Corchorus olitorius TaxID=93759 RepID=A0A1R3KMJ1_9ROSI|nr:hypothetical protein COLO4_06598 [Corchorus olitorius]
MFQIRRSHRRMATAFREKPSLCVGVRIRDYEGRRVVKGVQSVEKTVFFNGREERKEKKEKKMERSPGERRVEQRVLCERGDCGSLCGQLV